jgi:hypothetical protein
MDEEASSLSKDFFFFKDKVLLCGPGCSGTRDPMPLPSQELGLQV